MRGAGLAGRVGLAKQGGPAGPTPGRPSPPRPRARSGGGPAGDGRGPWSLLGVARLGLSRRKQLGQGLPFQGASLRGATVWALLMGVSLTGYGGVGEIGGNAFLLEAPGLRVFLDLGKRFGATTTMSTDPATGKKSFRPED